MANFLLRFCKNYHHYTNKTVATALGISARQYMNIERGDSLLTHNQPRQLGRLYKMNGRYFYEAARQLDLLQTRVLLIKILKSQNERLEEVLKKGMEVANSKTREKKITK